MEVEVKVSGVCLASILETFTVTDGDIEGFIVGHLPSIKETITMEDTSSQSIKYVCTYSKNKTNSININMHSYVYLIFI